LANEKSSLVTNFTPMYTICNLATLLLQLQALYVPQLHEFDYAFDLFFSFFCFTEIRNALITGNLELIDGLYVRNVA